MQLLDKRAPGAHSVGQIHGSATVASLTCPKPPATPRPSGGTRGYQRVVFPARPLQGAAVHSFFLCTSPGFCGHRTGLGWAPSAQGVSGTATEWGSGLTRCSQVHIRREVRWQRVAQNTRMTDNPGLARGWGHYSCPSLVGYTVDP